MHESITKSTISRHRHQFTIKNVDLPPILPCFLLILFLSLKLASRNKCWLAGCQKQCLKPPNSRRGISFAIVIGWLAQSAPAALFLALFTSFTTFSCRFIYFKIMLPFRLINTWHTYFRYLIRYYKAASYNNGFDYIYFRTRC